MLRTYSNIVLVVSFLLLQSVCHADNYNLNVQIIRVCDDAGANCTNLGPAGGLDESYLYKTQVDLIWDLASIQVTYLPTIIWNNTEGQRLTSAERSAIYGNTFAAGTGSALPGIAVDAVQIFYVMDHPGTGYDGTAGSGWVGMPLPDPTTSARNAGNAQLFISGTFASNGRSVMANEGFASTSLASTLAHEIGHLMGLRHTEDVPGSGAGTTQDPTFTLPLATPNLMWGAGSGGAAGTTLIQPQIDAAIFNGLRLDPDGNGIGVLQAIPEPSSLIVITVIGIGVLTKRRRSS